MRLHQALEVIKKVPGNGAYLHDEEYLLVYDAASDPDGLRWF